MANTHKPTPQTSPSRENTSLSRFGFRLAGPMGLPSLRFSDSLRGQKNAVAMGVLPGFLLSFGLRLAVVG